MHFKLMSLTFKLDLTQESEEETPSGQLPGAAALAATPDVYLDETRLQQAARDWLTNISSS
jgi:hypothetical protein